jgi:hypothetical protein
MLRETIEGRINGIHERHNTEIIEDFLDKIKKIRDIDEQGKLSPSYRTRIAEAIEPIIGEPKSINNSTIPIDKRDGSNHGQDIKRLIPRRTV